MDTENLVWIFFANPKILGLHAILHDAVGSIQTNTHKEPGYCYVLPILLGHVTGLIFCSQINLFASIIYRLFDC